MLQSNQNSSHWSLKITHQSGTPLQFKFIVDGEWTVSPQYHTITNGNNINNTITPMIFTWKQQQGDCNKTMDVRLACDCDDWNCKPMAWCHYRKCFILKREFGNLKQLQFKVNYFYFVLNVFLKLEINFFVCFFVLQFVVNGEWKCSDEFQKSNKDGIENNVIYF